MSKMTCKNCIHSGLCYKENDYENFPDKCGSFIPEKLQGECEKCPFKHTEKCDVCIHRLRNMQSEPERPQGECCGVCYLCDIGDCGADMVGDDK